jgi:hypothetical protein
VALHQILRTFIKSVENKVACDQISGNLGGVEQYNFITYSLHITLDYTYSLHILEL